MLLFRLPLPVAKCVVNFRSIIYTQNAFIWCKNCKNRKWFVFCLRHKIGCQGNVPWGIGKFGRDQDNSHKYLPFGEKIRKIGPVDTELAFLWVKTKKLTQAKYIALPASLPSGLNKKSHSNLGRGCIAAMLYGNMYGFGREAENSNAASVPYLTYLAFQPDNGPTKCHLGICVVYRRGPNLPYACIASFLAYGSQSMPKTILCTPVYCITIPMIPL